MASVNNASARGTVKAPRERDMEIAIGPAKTEVWPRELMPSLVHRCLYHCRASILRRLVPS